MREIKFRAWNSISKGMKTNQQTIELMAEGNPCEYQIMQYAGKKDKNGVEIYESDIVEYTTKRYGKLIKHVSEIIFKDGSFLLKNNKTCVHDFATYSIFGLSCVIGNIYENAELLNG